MDDLRGAPLTLSEVARRVGGRLEGPGERTVEGIAPVDEAAPTQMAFLASKRYARYADGSRAGAFLVTPELRRYVPDGVPAVVVRDAYPALRTLLEHFHPPEALEVRVHPTAVLGRDVRLGEGVSVGPYAVLEDGVEVGAHTRIGAHCVLGRRVCVGNACLLHPQVVVYPDSVLGDRVVVHAGARIGSDGFGFTFVDGRHLKMPQVGRAVIEDDVEIGANSTIDRGSLGDTVLGRGSKLDNLVHLAHNVKVGALSLFAALVGVAGSTRVGERVWMGGQVGVSNHLHVGDGARLAIACKVMRDVRPGETVSGHPARPHREQLRNQARLNRLEKLVARVRALEERVRALEAGHGGGERHHGAGDGGNG